MGHLFHGYVKLPEGKGVIYPRPSLRTTVASTRLESGLPADRFPVTTKFREFLRPQNSNNDMAMGQYLLIPFLGG